MVWCGPTEIPARLAVMPELTDDDARWLNQQLDVVDQPTVRYARHFSLPPPPTGGRRDDVGRR